MAKDGSTDFGWDSPIERPEGVTDAERSLKRLCDRSFLSLWSHAGIYRDQGKVGKGHGKEVCDLLVVFEDHIIIFSDKDCSTRTRGTLGASGVVGIDAPSKNRRIRSTGLSGGSSSIPTTCSSIVPARIDPHCAAASGQGEVPPRHCCT